MLGRESITVRLKITSATLTPTDIEARLGVKPDESWKLGDRTGVFGAVEKAHCFTLVSTLLPTASLEEHFAAMIKRLTPLASKIGEFAAQAKIQMICTIQRKTLPRISFGRDDIRWLGVMGAQLDVEVSLLADPARDAALHGRAGPDESSKPTATDF